VRRLLTRWRKGPGRAAPLVPTSPVEPPATPTATPTATSKTPESVFWSPHYQRHNARRLEHLASLRIPVGGKTVLELGAGVGDHTHYFVDRGCRVTITEARAENLAILSRRYPGHDVRALDLERPVAVEGAPFDVVYAYGVLYHLDVPAEALAFMANACRGLLLLETCVSFGDEDAVNLVEEASLDPSQAISGTGCRPTRPWIFRRLRELFEHVYVTRTQPNHEEFPIDWNDRASARAPFARSVFVAAREPLANPLLSDVLLTRQQRHP
jgi:SAM-dependent methyltransferase